MSSRRSARLASKANTGNQEVGAGDSDLIYEEISTQHANLRPLTQRTPLSRSGQKRKRGKGPLSSPVIAATGNDANPENGRSNDTDVPNGVSPRTPTVLTPSGASSCFQKLSLDGSAAFSPLSLENGSFLLALDKIESDEKISEGLSEPIDSQCETVCDNNGSPDVFGDDDDILDALPPTPENVTPRRSPQSSIPPKRLAVDMNPEAKPAEAVGRVNGFQSAKDFHELEQALNVPKGPKPKRGRKRSTIAGEKKKNAGGQGKGTKEKKKNKGKFKLAFTNRKHARDLANSASNELSIQDLSCLSEAQKLQLSSWGLPPIILNNYRLKGITSLFQWQLACLENPKVLLEGRNLLYSAPTSAGKTLVSEILMIKRVLELGRKAIMILPFVSVAREKVYSLQSIFGDAGIRVEGFMGSVNPPGGFKAVDIAICTIEKANSLLNKLLEENALGDLGTVVVDELHLIGDPHRGYLLELLLTKILYMTTVKNCNAENSLNTSEGAFKRFPIQIIGMSATLPNLHVLADWLNAELYVTDFRPVPLMERLKVEDKLFDEKLEAVRDVKTETIPIQIGGDTDDIVYMTLETVLNGFSVLIFCPTKVLVEQTALRITSNFFKIGDPTNNFHPELGVRLRGCLDGNRIKSVLDQLTLCAGGADEVLTKTIMFGIGYHHAGLTYENRDIVESAFKRGILKVIVATSTLSAGVNLPARRVLITTPMFNRNILDTMTYRQMCGRAGRNGIDTEGESILICPANLKEKGTQLFQGKMPIVRSALKGDGSLTSSVKRALLEAIASGIASLTTDVNAYARCTFLFHSLDAGLYDTDELSSSQIQKEATIDECVEFLKSQDFIRMMQYEDKPDEYKPTQLGSACLAASFSPDDGIIVYKELLKARECFVLENELHVIYQVTPIYVSDQLRYISWAEFLKIYENLDASEKKVADLVGIKEGFIIRAMMIGITSGESEREVMAIHQRFFAALALSDLVNEKTLDVVGKKYGLSKGVLQNLQQAASTFAGMVTAFCGRLGWSNLELLLSQFQERLEFGVQRELCDLVRMECLNGQRARILYDAGLKTIVELAAADPAQVEHILHKATPFNSNVHGGRESSIWMIGKESLTEAEAAQKIVQDARAFIQIELGHKGNIQFAFGANDAPIFKAIQEPDLGGRGHNDSNRMNSMILNNSKNQKQFERFSVNDSTSKKSLKLSQNRSQSARNSVAVEGDNENVEDRDIQMEEFFTQRQQEEEKLEVLPILESDNRSDPALFEDSFPEIIATEISALYNKFRERSDEDQQVEKFSIEKEVEKVAVVKPQVPVRDGKTLVSRMQTDSINRLDNVQRLHSTPLIASTSKQPYRFTLRQSELASPVRAVSPHVENAQHFHEIKKSVLDTNCVDLSHGILAEFEKDFNSCDDVFDCSMDVDGREENNDNVPELISNKNGGGQEQCESVGLSASVTEAMHALAEDTHFDSEELFPDDNKANNTAATSSKSVVSHCSKPENGRSSGFDDEDFILTQGSWTSNKDVEKEGNDIFEESCSDTESSSAWTDSHSTQVEAAEPTEVAVHETMVGKMKLTTKIVRSADAIPSTYFLGSEVIGLGLKLTPHKKPSASIAMQGIGSKIICKSGAVLTATLPQGETFHSLAMYNGSDTIWVLRWENENGLRVGGSRNKNSTGNSSLVKALLKIEEGHCAITLFESKEKIKNLLRHCGASILPKLPPGEKIWDPRIAQWMWDFDEEDWNVSKRKLIDEYVTTEGRNLSSSNLDKEAVDAFFAWKVMSSLKERLLSNGLWDHYISTEMPSIVPILLMEMNGLGLDSVQLSKLKRVLQFKSTLLELRAFQLAGRQFSLGSPKEIKQILFREIGLKQPKAKGTSKDVLLKLDHALPGIIVEWRKVNSALQKVVIPFQQEKNLETGRVHGYYSHFTVTGRVVMSEPSLQCIPRDFDILITYDSKEINDLKNTVRIKFGTKLTALLQQLDTNAVDAYILNNISQISMRNAFIPCSNDFVVLTADYSQLELRILAHLSGDAKLLETLNKDTDVFTEIAAQWKNLPRTEITNSLRQEAKGIVYGVIYGMGTRTLAEQMEIDEREASRFITQFMRTYPGVSAFTEKAPKLCQEKGYVETMTGRRRYLPLIHSRLAHEKAKAGRQAVNTQIQGSAADLVKVAMTRIYAILRSNYPKSAVPIEWNKLCKARRSSLSIHQSNTTELDNLVFFPVLNLHDELIFEVRKTHLEEVAKIVKREMESCIKLNVKLPVVVKTGDSWGTVKVYDFK